MTITEPGPIEVQLSDDLRSAVLDAIKDLNAEDLARQLNLVPTAVRALLQRDSWPLKTALVMAEGLHLPLLIRIDRRR